MKISKMDRKFVLIIWRDAADPDSPKAWYTDEEVDSFTAEEVMVRSSGWVKSETSKYITLVSDFIPNGDGSFTWSRPTKIPVGMVQEICELPIPAKFLEP